MGRSGGIGRRTGLKILGTAKVRTGSSPVSGTKSRGVEQSVARRAHNPKVGGSNPSPATKGGVAQLARACGSYPQCQRFKSVRRHQKIWPRGQEA